MKDPPPERKSHANKRDSMSNGELFSSEWQQIDRIVDEVKGEGGRVCSAINDYVILLCSYICTYYILLIMETDEILGQVARFAV